MLISERDARRARPDGWCVHGLGNLLFGIWGWGLGKLLMGAIRRSWGG